MNEFIFRILIDIVQILTLIYVTILFLKLKSLFAHSLVADISRSLFFLSVLFILYMVFHDLHDYSEQNISMSVDEIAETVIIVYGVCTVRRFYKKVLANTNLN